MEGFGGVLVLGLVMLAGSYLAGSIPLHLAMSEEKLQVGGHYWSSSDWNIRSVFSEKTQEYL